MPLESLDDWEEIIFLQLTDVQRNQLLPFTIDNREDENRCFITDSSYTLSPFGAYYVKDPPINKK